METNEDPETQGKGQALRVQVNKDVEWRKRDHSEAIAGIQERGVRAYHRRGEARGRKQEIGNKKGD